MRPRPSQRWLCGPPSADRRGGDGKGRALVWFGLIVLVAATLSACASATSMRNGRFAEQGRDYDRAVIEYTKALREHPTDSNARQALERMKLRAAQEHFTRARRLATAGNLDEALIEYQLAAELNPDNPDIEDAVRTIRSQLRNKIAIAREGKTQLESLIERSKLLAPPGLDLPPDVKLPESLTFRDAGSRDVYTAMARFANINVVFDPQFRDQPVTVDLRNTTLADALTSVSTATRNFYRVTAARTITIIPDTPAKRREYEEEVVRTFYLSNADLKETIDLLRIVIDARRIAPIAATNALTIKDTPERVDAAARVIAAIDKARPEVVIEVELLEVDRTRLLEYGLQLASPGSAGINGGADANRKDLTQHDLTNLSPRDIFLTNLPALYYRLLKRDSNTRTLANPQLRTSEGMPARARFGERVPVPVTTFSPIAAGGVQQQPITSFNYENIGVNLDITPRTHHDDQVSLSLRVEVSSISGAGFGGLPTFGNREINTVIRLRDGETNMLAGLIRDDERRVLEGIPGLSDLPLIGRLFAFNHKETQETDIVLTLTPRIIRVLELTEADLRPFRVGRESGATIIDLPAPPPPLPPGPTPPPPKPPDDTAPVAPLQPAVPVKPPPIKPPAR
ncbi:MAG TPA: secretin N-terminal domain-containing protein [Vicinamibacterales bacterium]|nr:secretin N-terminal domain-containing protein [Vicinamibacterales bacterium]